MVVYSGGLTQNTDFIIIIIIFKNYVVRCLLGLNLGQISNASASPAQKR